ncbi:hypothetical protein Nmel_002700 [Mimus melanotis]
MPMELGQHHKIQCKCSVGSIRLASYQHLRIPGESGHVLTVAEPRVWITDPKRKGQEEQLHFSNDSERDTRALRPRKGQGESFSKTKFFPVSHTPQVCINHRNI